MHTTFMIVMVGSIRVVCGLKLLILELAVHTDTTSKNRVLKIGSLHCGFGFSGCKKGVTYKKWEVHDSWSFTHRKDYWKDNRHGFRSTTRRKSTTSKAYEEQGYCSSIHCYVSWWHLFICSGFLNK